MKWLTVPFTCQWAVVMVTPTVEKRNLSSLTAMNKVLKRLKVKNKLYLNNETTEI